MSGVVVIWTAVACGRWADWTYAEETTYSVLSPFLQVFPPFILQFMKHSDCGFPCMPQPTFIELQRLSILSGACSGSHLSTWPVPWILYSSSSSFLHLYLYMYIIIWQRAVFKTLLYGIYCVLYIGSEHTVYAEIFVVLKFSWVPSTTKIKPMKILPLGIITAHHCVTVMNIPRISYTNRRFSNSSL